MLLLIIGTKPAPPGAAPPAATPTDVEDAELASAADQARAAGGG
jgi:hypothetical protein